MLYGLGVNIHLSNTIAKVSYSSLLLNYSLVLINNKISLIHYNLVFIIMYLYGYYKSDHLQVHGHHP